MILLTSFQWRDAPLRDVIQDIQKRTDYRFLYRDALIADVRISLTSTESALITDLARVLADRSIGLQHDFRTRQIVLYPMAAGNRPDNRPLLGVVVDDESGTRLPYATVMWLTDAGWRGTTADESGRFRLPVAAPVKPLTITVRHIGFAPKTFTLGPDAWAHDVAVRLSPEPFHGEAVIVEQGRIEGLPDSTHRFMMSAGALSGFSEPSALRMLQALPSVAVNGAVSSGLLVRGSKPDGFQVLLDGVPVYNHHHLFGLFDPFNPDALQTVGIHTGITPASLPGPPGGTLQYLTRSASTRQPGGSFGVSSSAVRGTLDIPIWRDRASLLVAGRLSYLNRLDWFGNSELIHWGLNVDRRTSEPTVKTVFPTSADARFHDLHLKLDLEETDGSRWTVSMYTGGDDTRTDAVRYVRPILAPGSETRFETMDVSTTNRWGSTSAGLGRQVRLTSDHFLHAGIAYTGYRAEFDKDDFLYVRYNANQNRYHPTLNTFHQWNRLHEWRGHVHWDWILSAGWWLRSGITTSWMDVRYRESSLQRPDYGIHTRSVLTDVFTQADGRPATWLDLAAGLRVHILTLGRSVGWSPRVDATLFPDSPFRIGAGYSLNHQFLHSVSVKQQSSADVWITGTSEQPPSRSEHLTTAVFADPLPWLSLQADVYRKTADHVRLHEVNPSLLITREPALAAPWFYRNRMESHGLEVSAKGAHRHLDWMAAYTWSRTDFRNPSLNNGDAFPADWDRTHQGSLHLAVKPTRELALLGGLALSSGAPNTALEFTANEQDRLDPTWRLDAGITYRTSFLASDMSFRLSAYNVTDRRNVWYRTPVASTDRNVRPAQIVFRNLDVYDLGRHLSLDMRIGW